MERRYDAAFADLTTLHDLGTRAGIPPTAVAMLHALLSARAGRDADAARHLDEGRRLARQLEDPSAESGADLFEAMLALERGDHASAIASADRAAHITMDASVEIMRIRRSALAMMIAGIAEARRGRMAAARARLETLRQLDTSGDDIQASWRQGLAGEIALREMRFDEAEQAFRAAEYPIGSSFAIYPALVVLSNNPPFRDGLARTALARGDRSRARDLYERLNRPDAASTWEAVFEPRYARSAAQLATRLRSQPSVQRALAAP
jgi:tetratricopeptide (TPR) repeat protein